MDGTFAAPGIGAIAGAALMPRIRHLLTPDQLIVLAGVVYGIALVVVALVPVFAVVAAMQAVRLGRRRTGDASDEARAVALAAGPPVTTHLLPADSGD